MVNIKSSQPFEPLANRAHTKMYELRVTCFKTNENARIVRMHSFKKKLREALQGNVAHTACEGLVWVMRSHEEIRKKPKILSRTTSAALQA